LHDCGWCKVVAGDLNARSPTQYYYINTQTQRGYTQYRIRTSIYIHTNNNIQLHAEYPEVCDFIV